MKRKTTDEEKIGKINEIIGQAGITELEDSSFISRNGKKGEMFQEAIQTQYEENRK